MAPGVAGLRQQRLAERVILRAISDGLATPCVYCHFVASTMLACKCFKRESNSTGFERLQFFIGI